VIKIIKTKKLFQSTQLPKQNNNLKNIILITLDAFNFKLFENNIHFLPNLKKLKENGVFFTNAFSIGPMTHFSFPGIIGGIYPYNFGIGINENVKTIDYILSKNGYNTAFINEAQAFLTPFFGYCKNIHYSKNFLELSQIKRARQLKNFFLKEKQSDYYLKHSVIIDKIRNNVLNIFNDKTLIYLKTVKCMIRFIQFYLIPNYANYKGRIILYKKFIKEIEDFLVKRFKEPQFLWIHTRVNHLPYLPPYDTTFSERKINYLNYRGMSQLVNYKCAQELKSLFVESLKTVDNLIEKIITKLKINKILENSIIIITADHGEEFMEEGYYGHTIDSSSDNLLRVPLIFYYPKNFKNQIISIPVSTIDILPTITNLLNIEKPKNAKGISLKKCLLNDFNDPKEKEKFWWRPLYSESWKTFDLLDRSPGYKSKERVFTIRVYKYKLKIKQRLINNNVIEEKYLLKNWVINKKLNMKNNLKLIKELKNILYEHISN